MHLEMENYKKVFCLLMSPNNTNKMSGNISCHDDVREFIKWQLNIKGTYSAFHVILSLRNKQKKMN